MARILAALAALAALAGPAGRAALAAEAVISGGGVEVRFDKSSGAVRIADKESGPILLRGGVKLRAGGKEISSDERRFAGGAVAAGGELRLALADGLALRVSVGNDGTVKMRLDGTFEGAATFQAVAAAGRRAMPAIPKDEQTSDRGVLVMTLGQASVARAKCLFDPKHDLALGAAADGGAEWRWDDAWKLRTSAPAGGTLLSLRVRRHYYRDELGIRHYAPIRKPARWQTAPVVAMTWYGIEGSTRVSGRYVQTREWLYPNVDWVAEHLLPYAGSSMVFQLDDNYREMDDKYMRELSDYIRSKGLVPGIWFTPYNVGTEQAAREHPDWFLRDKGGRLIRSFAGVNWGWPKNSKSVSAGVLNLTRGGAVSEHFAPWWRKASDTWNYDFFKIDGLPGAVRSYQRSANGGGVETFRKGLGIARKIVGPEKFINGCSGVPLAGIDLMNGSRTGPDTGPWPHACDVIARWNFLNNVAWWCDPDAAANQHRSVIQRVRLNAAARVLTGQQFLTDDVWVKVPPGVRWVWQRSFPMLDIRPANLYPIENWRRYDVYDLRVARPWGTRDVVGLFNYNGEPGRKTLDLARLPIQAPRVHVYEFWTRTYLGRFARDAKIPFDIDGGDAKVLAVVPAPADRPALISASRHLTQGALSVRELEWSRSGRGWTVRGRSSHLVAGDPYELTFAAGAYRAAKAASSAGAAGVSRDEGVTRVTFTPSASGQADWQVTFEPIDGVAFDVVASAGDVREGVDGQVQIISRGVGPVGWRAKTTDKRLRVVPTAGKLGPAGDRAVLKVVADASGLGRGEVALAKVIVEAEAPHAPSQQARVRLRRAYDPPNLALPAKARASSEIRNFQAHRANDGYGYTRWNAKGGGKNNWIGLRWDRPVRIDRVVIDECTNTGYDLTEHLYADRPPAKTEDPAGRRIGKWRLEAGTGKTAVIARGQGMGRWREIAPARPVVATSLRLVIETARGTPTIWEMKVYGAEAPRAPAELGENLAARARATASSAWDGGYQAGRVNDGKAGTRWNSALDDKDGCWVQLAWDKPVTFDRVIIDECMDFGHRIRAWRLEAGDEKLEVVARGAQAGARLRVELARPVKAARLRLVVEKASVVPTIRELEVYGPGKESD